MSAMPPPQPAGPVPPHVGHPPLPLPPPPLPVGAPGPTGPGLRRAGVPAGAGQLTPGWRTLYLVAWAGVVLVYASVWRTARTMGMSTWWLGSSSDPQFMLVQLVPFIGPSLAVIAAGRNHRFLPHLGIVVGLVGIGIAVVDTDQFPRLAVLQLTAAGAGLLASVAALAGFVRRGSATD